MIAQIEKALGNTVDARARRCRNDRANRARSESARQPNRSRLGEADRLKNRVEPGIVHQLTPAAHAVVAGTVDEEDLGRGPIDLLNELAYKRALDTLAVGDRHGVGEGEKRHGQGGDDHHKQRSRALRGFERTRHGPGR